MNLTLLFWTICGIYFTAWIICCISFFSNNKYGQLWGERLLILGLGIQVLFIVTGALKLGNFLFDSLSGLFLFLSFFTILIFIILNFSFPNQIFKIIFPPLSIFFLILSITISNKEIIAKGILDKSPIFGKFMLYTHATCAMLGYLLFGVACLTSMFFLYQERKIKSKTLILQDVRVPSLGFLDALNYKVITVGFLLLTVGLLFGINMKLISSGGHSGVTLRQILPITTWLIYALFLIDRFINGLRGKITSLWAIAGFCTAVASFTYEVYHLIQRT